MATDTNLNMRANQAFAAHTWPSGSQQRSQTSPSRPVWMQSTRSKTTTGSITRALRFCAGTILGGLGAIVLLVLFAAGLCSAIVRRLVN